MTVLPTLFAPHGAPTFALDSGAAGRVLAEAAGRWPRPRAILAVSAHWATARPALGAAAQPDTVHDFHGFPAPLYALRYPAPGDPSLVRRAAALLGAAGWGTDLIADQGLDHAVWIPLSLMYPAADVPVVPLAVQPGLGPSHHLRLGRALAPLREEGVLIVASGNLTHNLRDWHAERTTPAYVPRFADWVAQRLADEDVEALLDYRRQCPDAARAHPTEEHLLPLFVALGAAGPECRAERLYQGVSERILAMDSYVFWSSHP